LQEAIDRLDVPYTRSGQRKDAAMVNGAHAILYSAGAEGPGQPWAKVLGTRSVDAAGGGRFIFTLPLAELAVHPPDAGGRAVCTCCATTWPPPWPSS
jgi:hypothetical protein